MGGEVRLRAAHGIAEMAEQHAIRGLPSRFKVRDVLGSGGMGIVVAADDRLRGCPVAIKCLHPSRASDARAVARMLREARVLARLRSESIVRVFDVGLLETGEPYIVMELLRGETLADRLRRGALKCGESAELIAQAALGLEEAHEMHVLHRDLKPSNLFLEESARGIRLKVLDFGIATEPEGSAGGPSVTDSGRILGSPGYMAPEQVRGLRSVDARADVWALGATLYECLSGVPAFAASTPADTLVRILTGQPACLREIAPHVPAGLVGIVHICLEKEPRRRPASVREVAVALAHYTSSGSLSELAVPDAPATLTDNIANAPATAVPRSPRRWLSRQALVPSLAIAGIAILVPVASILRHAFPSTSLAPDRSLQSADERVDLDVLQSADERVDLGVLQSAGERVDLGVLQSANAQMDVQRPAKADAPPQASAPPSLGKSGSPQATAPWLSRAYSAARRVTAPGSMRAQNAQARITPAISVLGSALSAQVPPSSPTPTDDPLRLDLRH